jgi:DNA replication protein DnaC
LKKEIISFAKSFRINVLQNEKFTFDNTLSNEEFLLDLLLNEAKFRDNKAAAERKKQARFPTFKSIEKFDTGFQKGVTKNRLERPKNLTGSTRFSI